MSRTMSFVAVCQYPDKESFMFCSSEFYINHWSDLEKIGHELVEREWGDISPHPAPPIVKFIPGTLLYVSDKA